MNFFIVSLIIFFLLFSPIAGQQVNKNSSEYAKKQIELGIKAAQEGFWNEALFRWKKACEIDFNNPAAHNNLAIAFEQAGLFELALQEYEIAFRLAPNEPSIKANISSFKEAYRTKE